MKKIFSLAVLVAALMFAGTAKAQYGTCNARYQNGIPDQPMTLSVVMVAENYTAANPNAQEPKTAILEDVNNEIATQYPTSKIRFTEDESENFNIRLVFHLTLNSDNTYSLIIEGRGLGVGHLFSYHVPNTYGDAGQAVVTGINGLPTYLVNGWHANDGSACQ